MYSCPLGHSMRCVEVSACSQPGGKCTLQVTRPSAASSLTDTIADSHPSPPPTPLGPAPSAPAAAHAAAAAAVVVFSTSITRSSLCSDRGNTSDTSTSTATFLPFFTTARCVTARRLASVPNRLEPRFSSAVRTGSEVTWMPGSIPSPRRSVSPGVTRGSLEVVVKAPSRKTRTGPGSNGYGLPLVAVAMRNAAAAARGAVLYANVGVTATAPITSLWGWPSEGMFAGRITLNSVLVVPEDTDVMDKVVARKGVGSVEADEEDEEDEAVELSSAIIGSAIAASPGMPSSGAPSSTSASIADSLPSSPLISSAPCILLLAIMRACLPRPCTPLLPPLYPIAIMWWGWCATPVPRKGDSAPTARARACMECGASGKLSTGARRSGGSPATAGCAVDREIRAALQSSPVCCTTSP
mmetsp:Transcript_6100/g.15115  ORF Transcript_6100/g.15115 Transcript_6100/m.15115 type:complete len:412 (+) Transcript_6100:1034-2269(+)